MLHAFRESIGKFIAVGLLGLIAVTFIFFGIDFSVTQSPFAAKVNGTDIPMVEFDRELQAFQNQYQEVYRVELTDELRRQIRRQVIDRMILQEALRQHALDMGYYVSDSRLANSIRSTEAFQVGGQFSADTYQALLQANRLTPAMYEAQQRDSLVLAEFQDGLTASTFLTPTEFRRYIELTAERRQLGYALFSADAFLDSAVVDDAAIQTHYDENPSAYMTPETVDIEYVELNLDTIAAGIEITDADLRTYYDDNIEQFQTPEQRNVSQILITVEGDDVQAAEAKANAVLARVEGGEDFATVAAEESDDVGTRANGGNLGWISRGDLPGPFEDTLFSMQVGEVAGPVQTEFGYHILKLNEVRGGQGQPFDAVRDQIRRELSTERANALYYERANALRQAAFDAYDTLAPVAESQGLELKTIDGFTRNGDPAAFPNGSDVIARVFSDEAIVSGRNSDLIELSDDDVVAVRVKAHHDPEQESLDAVRDQIEQTLRRQAAEMLAADAAAAFSMELPMRADDPDALATEHGGMWNAAAFVARGDQNVPPEVLAAAFGVPRSAISDPVIREVPLRNGDTAVIDVLAVESGTPDDIPVADRDQRQRQLADQAANLEAAAYAAEVRDAASVRIPDDVLNPQF